MIMPRGSGHLLLPVKPWFMALSVVVALAISLLPLGRQPALPDILGLVIVFWGVHEPRRLGVFTAFVLGLLMDVHQGALLGQHALVYAVQSFAAVSWHRRLLWFPVLEQMVQVLPIFVLGTLLAWLIGLAAGQMSPGWSLVFAPIFQMLLWPVADRVLLAPQRRPPDPDKHRPL